MRASLSIAIEWLSPAKMGNRPALPTDVGPEPFLLSANRTCRPRVRATDASKGDSTMTDGAAGTSRTESPKARQPDCNVSKCGVETAV
jgi:hypothetical protein